MRKRGQEPGPAFIRPTLPPGLDWFNFAFQELSTCRPAGMGLMQIPWTAIKAFADDCGLDEDAADYLRLMVRALDAVWLAHHAPKGGKHGS